MVIDHARLQQSTGAVDHAAEGAFGPYCSPNSATRIDRVERNVL